jgi:hypothetical protein
MDIYVERDLPGRQVTGIERVATDGHPGLARSKES